MTLFQKLSTEQQKTYIFFGAIGFMALALLTFAGWVQRPQPRDAYNMTLPSSTALESRVLFGGDVYWGRRMNDWSQQSPLKEAYPFSQLKTLDRDRYDAWAVNLECPAVPGIKEPVSNQVTLHSFNCDASYLHELAKWFNVVSLSNNHTKNQNGEAGLVATRNALTEHGIQHFGDFNPHVGQNCGVVSMPARMRINGVQRVVAVPLAMCGFHGAYYTVRNKDMAEIERYAKYMPTIVMPHAGREYMATADPVRRALYQKMIDYGADAVLGNHPHWVQPAEEYKGKPIFYSMGNFIFDQQFSPEVMRAAAITAQFTVDEGAVPAEQLQAWVTLAESCKVDNDNCLTMAEQQNLAKLPIHIKYDVISLDLSNQITKKANMRTHEEVLARLNWNNIKQLLR